MYLGRLPQTSAAEPKIWRELRGYKNYIIVGSEAEKHGVQVFDLTKVRKYPRGVLVCVSDFDGSCSSLTSTLGSLSPSTPTRT